MNKQHEPITPGAIVVGLDGSEHSLRAIDWAADQAHAEGRTLTLICAGVQVSSMYEGWIAQAAMSVADLENELTEASRGLIETASVRVTERYPALRIESRIVSADPRNALIDASKRASLVVVGSRGRGPARTALLGSVSVAVARASHCPTVVCRPRPESPGRGVVVGADGSQASLPVIEFAFRYAAQHHLPLSVIHCLWEATQWADDPLPRDTERARLLLSESTAGFAEQFPDVEVSLELATGVVDQYFERISEHKDLLVLGRHEYGVLSRIVYGSISIAALERSHTTVALVPEASEETRPAV